MASTKTKVKPIRIANETAEYFEGKPLNRIVECIHHLLENGKLSFDGEEVKISDNSGVYTEESPKVGSSVLNVMTDIEEMALCSGLTLEEMSGQFCEMLNDGSLTVDGGVLQASEERWVSEFRETCHDLCIPVEKAGESAVKALRKGQI